MLIKHLQREHTRTYTSTHIHMHTYTHMHIHAGEFFMLNKHLQRELQALGLWSRQTRNAIIAAGGSVQSLPHLPSRLRQVDACVYVYACVCIHM